MNAPREEPGQLPFGLMSPGTYSGSASLMPWPTDVVAPREEHDQVPEGSAGAAGADPSILTLANTLWDDPLNAYVTLNTPGGVLSIGKQASTPACPVHGHTSANLHLTFPDAGINNEVYCLMCVRDLLREKITPLNEGGGVIPVLPVIKEPSVSRYDIIKQGDIDA